MWRPGSSRMMMRTTSSVPRKRWPKRTQTRVSALRSFAFSSWNSCTPVALTSTARHSPESDSRATSQTAPPNCARHAGPKSFGAAQITSDSLKTVGIGGNFTCFAMLWVCRSAAIAENASRRASSSCSSSPAFSGRRAGRLRIALPSTSRPTFSPGKQGRCRSVERRSDLGQGVHARRAQPPLQQTDVRSMHARQVGELFLRQSPRAARLCNRRRQRTSQ